jgi:hypothetical protein
LLFAFQFHVFSVKIFKAIFSEIRDIVQILAMMPSAASHSELAVSKTGARVVRLLLRAKQRGELMKFNEFHQRTRAAWISAIDEVAGPSAPDTTVWSEPSNIIKALTPIMGVNNNHAHLPGGGGFDLVSVEQTDDGDCLDFLLNDRLALRMKPRALYLERIKSAPAESFFLLELEDLKPSGVYSEEENRFSLGETGYEELVETNPQEYYSRAGWDEGEFPDGHKLPAGARLIMRFLRGKVILVAKGSLWNGSPATYDGKHSNMTSEEIRTLIKRAIA